jgi:DNA-binding transcriptional ArsR family regulator
MVSKVLRKRAQRAARLFKLVGSPTRTLILATLQKRRELPVQEIADELGMTHSAVSHQLSLLGGEKIVTSVKDGRTVRYSVAGNPEAKALSGFLKALM